MTDLQHCPACDEEYVAGVAACVECGGPLTPGPLARFDGAPAPPTAAAAPATSLDRLLAEMPGQQADQAVRALLLEGLTCRVSCRGLEKVYTPDRPPAEPFAVSLPVSVYVSAEHLEAAREILDSFAHDDLIGEQWGATDDSPAADGEPAEPDDEPETPGAGPIEPQGTSMRTAALIVLVVLVLLFLLGR